MGQRELEAVEAGREVGDGRVVVRDVDIGRAERLAERVADCSPGHDQPLGLHTRRDAVGHVRAHHRPGVAVAAGVGHAEPDHPPRAREVELRFVDLVAGLKTFEFDLPADLEAVVELGVHLEVDLGVDVVQDGALVLVHVLAGEVGVVREDPAQREGRLHHLGRGDTRNRHRGGRQGAGGEKLVFVRFHS